FLNGVLTLILTRVLFLALFLLAVYAVQCFWFVRAWTWIGSFSNGNWRFGLHAGLIALAAVLLASLLDPLLGHGVSRLSVGSVHLGKTLSTFARLWLVASFFGFLAVESVGAIEWVTNVAARLRPGVVADGFSSSRRTFFQYAAAFAGGLPLSRRHLRICRRPLALHHRARRRARGQPSAGTGWTAHCSALRHPHWRLHAPSRNRARRRYGEQPAP